MKPALATAGLMVTSLMLLGSYVRGQDWPQWRGPHRDAKATGFNAPATWPKELTQKWKVAVGNGVATPALVGDKLYVFTLEKDDEVLRCLGASDGKEVWRDDYQGTQVSGPANRFPGPRASPAVADGKVVTLGVGGAVSCYDAASGKKLWRNEDYKGSFPRFYTSSSPEIVDGLAICQVGSSNSGAVVAFELDSGKEKWKWSGDGTAYGSPVVLKLGDTKLVVAETEANIVAVNLADGKLVWKTPFSPRGKGRTYNAATPMVQGQTIFYTGGGRGTTAVRIEKNGDEITGKELWKNDGISVQFNTPVLENGSLFGITNDGKLFCLSAENGKTAWTNSIGGRGYGSVVAAGSVVLALTPEGDLVVFEPTDKEFKQIAKYKVGDHTYAYPVVSGKRLFVKDSNSLTLWTIE